MSDRNPNSFVGCFSSTIIATIGRPTLSRAVESVLSQNDLPEKMEVIVVNDSGSPLTKEQWQDSKFVTIINTMKHERCVARNAGAAIARGRYVHFLDDDDYMLPGAFKAFYEAACTSEAHFINGRTKFTDGDGNPTGESFPGSTGDAFVHVMAGSWLPLQASIVRTESFFKAGGFDLRFSRMGEQKDFIRRLARTGAFESISLPVACVIQDHEKSTADWTFSKDHSLWSRDNILDEKGAFGRMLSSAKTAYWRGKMVRAYLTCVLWQIKKRNPIEAFSRGCCATVGAALSFWSLFSHDFWRALLHEA